MNWQSRLDGVEALLRPFQQTSADVLRAHCMIGLGVASIEDWELVDREGLEEDRKRALRGALYIRQYRPFGGGAPGPENKIRDCRWREFGSALLDYTADLAADHITSYLPDEDVPEHLFDVVQRAADDPRRIVRVGGTRVIARLGGSDGLPRRHEFARLFKRWLEDPEGSTDGVPHSEPDLFELRNWLTESGYVVPDYD